MPGFSKAKCRYSGRNWRLWIRVVEARHVMWRGVDTRVAVRVGRTVQASSSRPASAAPYFGEEFTFTLSVPLEDLLDQVITLSVQQTQKCLPLTRVLGITQLDICTIWEQPGHQVSRKWALLNDQTTGAPAGFLLVDLAVLGEGDHLKLHPQDQTGSPIEQNLLAPSWAGSVRRCRARYAVRVFFAEGLPLHNPLPLSAVNSWPTDPSGSSSGLLTQSSSLASLSDSTNQEEQPLMKAVPKRIHCSEDKGTFTKKSHKMRIASRFLGSLPRNRSVPDVENQLNDNSESEISVSGTEMSGAVPTPRNVTRGLNSCGCKPRYLVRINFAGMLGTTTLQGCDHFQPAWSEEVLFPEMFPPLYQRMCIQLVDAGRVIAQQRLHLNRSTCDPAHLTLFGNPQPSVHGQSRGQSHTPFGGVIASYGPTFLNLSGPCLGRNPNKPTSVNNSVKGPQPRGRILIELRILYADAHIPLGFGAKTKKKGRTKIDPEVVRLNVMPFLLNDVWRTSNLTLACVVWDVSLISRSRLGNRKIGLQISLGSAGDHLLWQHTSDVVTKRMLRQSSLTGPRAEPHRATDCPYLYLPLGNVKPVLAVTARWPWCVPDLRAANHIDRLAHFLQLQLTSSGKLIEKEDPEAASGLVTAIDTVIAGCALMLGENEDTLRKMRDDESEGSTPPGLSNRAMFLVRQIEETALSVLEIGTQSLMTDPVQTSAGLMPSPELYRELPLATISTMYRKAFVLLGTMHDVIGELGGGLPDVTLWLLADDKRVGAITLPARWLLAARKQARRGRYCGRMHAVFLRDVAEDTAWYQPKSFCHCKPEEGGSVLAKVEAVFWLGTRRSSASAIQRLLPGGSIRTKRLLPLAYNFVQEFKYECVAHIYQGRFAPGADRSGLNDPFVRVVFGPHCAQTEVSEASLSPRWQRSLRLPAVTLYGDPTDVQSRPPMVVIEAWDRDLWTNEFLGRVLVKPRVRLLNQTENRRNSKVSFMILPNIDDTNTFSKPKETIFYGPSNDWNGGLDLRWLPMSVGTTRTGDVLAAVELVQVPNDSYPITEFETSADKKLSKERSGKKSKGSTSEIAIMTSQVSPQYSTYRIEILFWGLRDVPTPLVRPPDHHFIVFEIAGTFIQSSRLDPNVSLNFPDCYKSLKLTLPTVPELLPSVHIKLLRRQVALLCRQYVATNVIPSLSAFLWDFEHEAEFYDESTDMNIFRTVRRLSSDNEAQKLDDTEDEEGDTGPTILLPKHDNRNQTAEKSTTVGKTPLNTPDMTDNLQSQRISDTMVSRWKRASSEINPPPITAAEIPIRPETGPSGERVLSEGPPPPRPNHDPEVGWWARYYTSLNHTIRTSSSDDIECGINPVCRRMSLKRWNPQNDSENLLDDEFPIEIYPNELEAQYEFENFQDFLYNIELNRGKAAFPEDSGISTEEGRSARLAAASAAVSASFASHRSAGQVIATLKTSIRLQRLSADADADHPGRLIKLADNGRQQVTVRVYVIRAHALHGRQNQSRADPYVSVTFGSQHYDGRDSRQRGVLDPIFGKCVQFQGEFPCDHRLTVRVMDHVGVGSGDQLLGQTVIDIENRFYSRHLGGCGLPRRYNPNGPNAWRDSRKPTDILTGLCRVHNLPDPVIDLPRAVVTVGDYLSQAPKATLRSPDPRVRTEEIALAGLLSWHTFPRVGCTLVPAHVETRSLIHPLHPGVEQGKLEMWVDVLPTGTGGPWSGVSTTLIVPPPVDVEPPLPGDWELRIIVLQAQNVVGTEWSIFSHEVASDVYVVGWIGGIDHLQKTDVHFRSVDGEALFNWRFVFPFQYVSAEGRIVIGDRRVPPRVHLALMDYDTFTKNDILGSMTLDLKKLQRPAPNASGTERDDENTVEVVDLFGMRHARGWWTVMAAEAAAKMGKVLAGKVELDLQLLTQEEAALDPVGLGRKPPHELAKPQRPNDAISMLRHPWRGFYQIVWKKNRVKIICSVLLMIAVGGLLAGVVSLPKYLVKRFFGF